MARGLSRLRRRPTLSWPDEPPHDGSVKIMRVMDRMPEEWRTLVYEYGFLAVTELWANQMSADDAWMALEARRIARQQEWLSTNYVIKRDGFVAAREAARHDSKPDPQSDARRRRGFP